jgi:D-sedoheptulose 7-phosphate isomerase
MTTNIHDSIDKKVAEVKSVCQNLNSFPTKELAGIVEKFFLTFSSGNRIAFIGNGGSAAESIHLAAEFSGKCIVDHKPLPVMSLNESQSSITAIGNDYGFDHIFSRQVQAHLRKGDLLIALSTSGQSKNILEALDMATKMNVEAMLWMGDFEVSIPKVQIFKVPSKSTPRIQEVHLAWGHIIAEIIESNMDKISDLIVDYK